MNYIFLLVFFNFLGRKWIQWNIRCDIGMGCCLIPGLCLFLSCPVLVGDFITATIHHEQKVRWGGKGLFNSHFHIDVHHWRKSQQELKHGRILEAGTGAAAMEGSCLVTCFPWLFSFLSYRTSWGITHHGLGLPSFITNWENVKELDLMESFPQLSLHPLCLS